MKEVIADRAYRASESLELPTTVGRIHFHFQGSSPAHRASHLVYRYRLEGYEEDWKQTRETQAEYPQLRAGKYRFCVQAVDTDLNYSDIKELPLSIIPDPRVAGLTEALRSSGASGEFVGESAALQNVLFQIEEVARTNLSVLILGETGTGKGLVARAIHGMSMYKDGPFISVTCGGIPEGLVESELFGHEKGAFTGAVFRKLGKVELAEGGTLFLDEIGDLPLLAQAKLLRFLEERTFERVGGEEILSADVRVIAATNRDLQQMISAGQFREDLYYRLQQFVIHVPPLRERREDIRLLVSYFLSRMAAHLNKMVTHLTSDALAALEAYDWPGNVRELEHAVQRAVIVCQGPSIRAEDVVLELRGAREGSGNERVPLEEHERRYIREVLEQTGWVIKGARGAARILGLPEATLRYRMKKLGIHRG